MNNDDRELIRHGIKVISRELREIGDQLDTFPRGRKSRDEEIEDLARELLV